MASASPAAAESTQQQPPGVAPSGTPPPAKPIPPGAKPTTPTAAKPAGPSGRGHFGGRDEARALLRNDAVEVLPGVLPDVPDQQEEEFAPAQETPDQRAAGIPVTSKQEIRAAEEQQEKQEKVAAADAKAGRQRGPDGKFLPKAGETVEQAQEAGAAEEAAPTEQQTEKPAEEQPAGEPFRFANREFKSLADAEQAFRSFFGRAEKVGKLEKDIKEAVNSAHGWHQHAAKQDAEIKALQAKIAAYEGGGAPPAAASTAGAPSAAASVNSLADAYGLDPQAKQVIVAALANPAAYGYKSTEAALVDAFETIASLVAHQQSVKHSRELEDVSRPLKEQQQVQAHVRESAQLFEQMRNAVYDDGTTARWPELQDRGATDRIIDIWRALGAHQDWRLVQYAIDRFREERSSNHQPAPTTDELLASLPPETPERKVAHMSGGPLDTPRSTAPRRRDSNDEVADRIRESIRRAGVNQTGLPGVEP